MSTAVVVILAAIAAVVIGILFFKYDLRHSDL